MRVGFIVILSVVFVSINSRAQNREEFNGPFAGWADVKRQFGAKGNGKDDDTRAIQKAIDGLSNPVTKFNMSKGAYMVLYFPAGTYCISSTLVMRGKIGVTIIGEDPANTIIKWIGPDKDTLFWANGSAYYKIARFTWDGNWHRQMEGIGIHWKNTWNDGQSQSFASLNIEISDCNFIGGFQMGLSGGTSPGEGTNANDSEITIKRCVFQDCWDAGIAIHGYNALDYWIWDCRFLKCQLGVKCEYGNYHVYRSYFSASNFGDVRHDNGYYTSVRGCYSENSNGFSSDAGGSCNPFKRTFQNNIVLNLKKYPIEFYHIGKVTLWHNTFSKVQEKSINYSVHTGSWCPAIYEVMSINNKYEVKDPLWNAMGAYTKFVVKDTYGAKLTSVTSAAAFLKETDPVPPKKARKIFEVPPGADSRDIQNIINQAASLKGQRPVIHFGVGTWYIDKTLVIPAGSDLQLTGDGLLYASVLAVSPNNNLKNAPLIQVKGPSYITIRDIQIGKESDKLPASVVFENVDQPSSQAHLDQIYSMANISLVSENQDYLYIEKNNSFFTDGNLLTGGPLTKQGKGTARVCCYGGQFARVTVNNGARFIAKDCWWEGNLRVPLDLKGSGEISLDGAMVAPRDVDSLPTIRIKDFNGKISLLNMYVQGSVAVEKSNAALNLLLWNINFYHKMNPYEYIQAGNTAQIALLGSNAQCFDKRELCKNVLSIPDKLHRVNDLPGFLEKMTAFDRGEKPVLYRNLPAGVSNIYLSRVSIGPASRGIVFTK